ncbi:right-handed parallel beta-helix repeat-containing protein [Azospirillum doebereinerae]|uniref:right-handed parallel beta-helix repeat-containing protein n=1 Tax=Azospirillum doebereinerae TaxID=92933 RepID=UPI001EE58FB9|nr:right-handed parallel beta-helix repeat-containing protein [Azospirillum doebereinerae]MCG5238861.1 right-handed parallel beta-helix repeat-containing protein [Azospirillum doebereinerae]
MTDSASQAFFVATNGNDSWSGRLAAPNAEGTDGPFATLDRAQSAMRATGVRDTYVRGGTYTLDRTVTLTGADNGVRIMAYPGETPVLSGGQRVTGFTDLGGGLYAAPVASATGLDLSIGGVRQKVAQSGDWNAGDAKSGWSFLEAAATGASKTSLRYTAGDASVPASVQAGTVIQTFDTEHLADNIVGVAGIDTASRTISFTQGVQYALRTGGTFRLLNDDAFLRDAGEFAWRAEDGRLVVKPQDAATLLSQGAVVSRLGTLVALNGASGVTLQGLTFSDTVYDGSALTLTNAADNSVAGNRFVNVGTAMTLTGSPRNTIEANRLEHLGASGIKVGYGSNANLISGNSISDIGEVLKGVAGVSVYGSNDTRITGNDIRNSPRYGVSLKNWDSATVNTGTVVEYNRIWNTMLETADGGAIEMLGRSNVDTRTVIQGNDIRNVGGLASNASGWLERYKSFGVYLDDMANGVTVKDNFIQNTGWASVFVHGGDSNRVTNNVAVLSNPRERFIRLEWSPNAGTIGLLADNSVTGNVIASSTGVDYWEFWTPGSYSVTGNLVQGTRVFNSGDAVGSGLFVNAAAGDYRLSSSAAASLGIHDLDWARIGTAAATVPGIPAPSIVASGGTGGVAGGSATPTAAASVAAAAVFVPLAYIASYTDLSAAFGANAAAGLAHYIANGQAEGRTVTFNPLAYTASYLDLSSAFGTDPASAAAHYITSGRAEGRTVTFDPLAYAASYADLGAAFGTDQTSAAAHYIASGRAEGRKVTFDPLAYVAANPDLAAAFGTNRTAAETHYLTNGRAENRSTVFNATAYLAANPDVAAATGGDLGAAMRHYALMGRLEGRALSVPVASSKSADVLASAGLLAAASGGM